MEDRIVKIKRLDRRKTIDITVDGDHCFFANGILTHNSGFGDTNPSLNKTADSIGVPFTTDFMGFLWQNDGDREAEVLNMTVLKNRLGGMIGKRIQYGIDYRNLIISDLKRIEDETVDSAMSDILQEIENM